MIMSIMKLIETVLLINSTNIVDPAAAILDFEVRVGENVQTVMSRCFV